MKITILLISVISFAAFAKESNLMFQRPILNLLLLKKLPTEKQLQLLPISIEEQELEYANIYSNYLISEFDKLLDHKIILNDNDSILDSQVYTRLISARDFIEQRNHKHTLSEEKKVSSNLYVSNQLLYNAVIDQINANAEEMMEQKRLEDLKIASKIEPSIYRNGNVRGNSYPKNVWSLTYDDGPKKINTKKIVDYLYSNNVKATFFMLTRNAKALPELVDYVENANMEVALHSYTHKNLKKASDALLEKEISEAKKDLEEVLIDKINLFRLPYGAGMRVDKVRKKIAQNKMLHVFWDVDTLDWKDKNPNSIHKRALKQMKLRKKKGGIILFHDIQDQTIKASKLMVDYLIKNNLKTCTVGDLVKFNNEIPNDCLPLK